MQLFRSILILILIIIINIIIITIITIIITIITIIIIIIITIIVTVKGVCYKMETISMNTENSKTNEAHRFKLDLTDKLNLKYPKKNMTLANLSIY